MSIMASAASRYRLTRPPPIDRLAATDALESRSHWFVVLFAVSCVLGSAYSFLQGAWPFGLVEAIWSAVALRRWIVRY
jgi:uncharacterized protein involved in exopolysaccharide biosynthesis